MILGLLARILRVSANVNYFSHCQMLMMSFKGLGNIVQSMSLQLKASLTAARLIARININRLLFLFWLLVMKCLANLSSFQVTTTM